ncbi:AraC family transcriptional regulator [Pseudomonas sp. S25]|uniref:AraC family transcriptional regulator n=1 Tax=Pseudomonas maioricensis TaxID=1766623 RepID=A0ABS9ZGY8_9PSED|nr:GlxA family transcriptional regulator [Pseudomonas sp. S25]MCI8209869.1 AraC family transcriptional regulator [Pseudomonas sp. S25]
MTEQPRAVHILAFPDVQILDVCGPLQVFASANLQAQQQGLPTPYHLKVIATQEQAVESSAGLGLLTWPLPPASEHSDTLIVAGGRGVQLAANDAELMQWLHERASASRRVASVCSGAFLLAATGLLDGRRVVTHWDSCEALARRYPALQVDPDPIFINDNGFWTSAGVTAGIDLALALVEEDLGHALALAVARHLVVFLKRPGGQSQFSATLSMQHASATDDARFADLHGWIIENLTSDLSVTSLAARMGMSERSFVRHYRAQTGITPAKAIEQLRVEAARRLLADSSQPVKRVAAKCGFGSEETMRRSFLRGLGVTPMAYRARFSG